MLRGRPLHVPIDTPKRTSSAMSLISAQCSNSTLIKRVVVLVFVHDICLSPESSSRQNSATLKLFQGMEKGVAVSLGFAGVFMEFAILVSILCLRSKQSTNIFVLMTTDRRKWMTSLDPLSKVPNYLVCSENGAVIQSRLIKEVGQPYIRDFHAMLFTGTLRNRQ